MNNPYQDLRQVEVYQDQLKKDIKFIGRFHGWGCEYAEFDNGAGNFTVAIVEKPDGTIYTPLPQMIKFTDV